MTKEESLADLLFEVVSRIEQISGSELSQEVDILEDGDYGVISAMVLDAAYWVLASQPSTRDLEDDLYVAANVYNELLHWGYLPDWAWEESKLQEMVQEIADDVQSTDDFKPGDYITVPGGWGGAVLIPGQYLSYDGVYGPIPDGAKETSVAEALAYLHEHADDILETHSNRLEAGGTTHEA